VSYTIPEASADDAPPSDPTPVSPIKTGQLSLFDP
jgi:hypothetical protein